MTHTLKCGCIMGTNDNGIPTGIIQRCELHKK